MMLWENDSDVLLLFSLFGIFGIFFFFLKNDYNLNNLKFHNIIFLASIVVLLKSDNMYVNGVMLS